MQDGGNTVSFRETLYRVLSGDAPVMVEHELMWHKAGLFMVGVAFFFIASFLAVGIAQGFGWVGGVITWLMIFGGALIVYTKRSPWRKVDLVNELVTIGGVKRSDTDARARRRGQLFVWYKGLRRFAMMNYVGTKSNPHILLAGISGVGKTTLLIHLIQIAKITTKVCFSFKSNDDYLRIGFRVLDIARALPDPFIDVDAFVSAFSIANPISSTGIQASYNPTMLRKMAAKSRSWKEFLSNVDKAEEDARKKRNSNEIASLSWIREKALQLTGPAYSKSIAEYVVDNPNIVVDFSQITNETARAFYSELVLRQIWSSKAKVASPQNKVIISFDEAHRLIKKQKYEQEFKSILETYLREGRSAGFWVLSSTQNYSDVEPKVGNNFATQFIFQTTNQDDLSALAAIDPMLSWTASSLPTGVFVDAKQPDIHLSIAAYQLAYPMRPQLETRYLEVPAVAEEPKQEEFVIPDEEVIALLKEKPRTPTGISAIIAQRRGLKFEAAKFKVSQVLTRMRSKQGLVDSVRFDLPNSQKFKVLYFLRGENISQLHNFMQEEVIRALEGAGRKILDVAKSGEMSKPDIETEQSAIEVETGLKRRFDDLEQRIGATKKLVVVIVPNRDIRDAYGKMFSSALVTCFYDFLDSMKRERVVPTAMPKEERREMMGASVAPGEAEGGGSG